MLSNAYFLAKFRFDTAENEPAKHLQNFKKMHFFKVMDDAAAVLLQEDRIPQLSRPVVGRLADVAAALGNEHQALFIRRCTPQRRVNSTARRRVERFDRRGTEPFDPFEPFEFFQNKNFPEFFLRKFKISEIFNIF